MLNRHFINVFLICAAVLVLVGYAAVPGPAIVTAPAGAPGVSSSNSGFEAYTGWLSAAHKRAVLGRDDTDLPSQF